MDDFIGLTGQTRTASTHSEQKPVAAAPTAPQ